MLVREAKDLYDRLFDVERELNSQTATDMNARYRGLNKLRVIMDDVRDIMNSKDISEYEK